MHRNRKRKKKKEKREVPKRGEDWRGWQLGMSGLGHGADRNNKKIGALDFWVLLFTNIIIIYLYSYTKAKAKEALVALIFATRPSLLFTSFSSFLSIRFYYYYYYYYLDTTRSLFFFFFFYFISSLHNNTLIFHLIRFPNFHSPSY